MTSVERAEWTIQAPAGGWATPWPQAAELANAIPSEQWTLVGGLMVQLHAAKAGVPLNRPTLDIDIVLHIETGAAVLNEVKKQLEELGYALRWPLRDGDPLHRFTRGPERTPQIVDVMIADHLAPSQFPTLKGHPVFQVPGATSALRKTVNCTIEIDRVPTRLSLPNVLGALVLKGAAFISDRNDTQRHLDDAAILASAIGNPIVERVDLTGTDPGTVVRLARDLLDRCRTLTKQINELTAEITTLVTDMAPFLIAIPGCGAITAAKILGETAGVDRFRSKDAYARHNGTAPMPVWSSNRARHRLSRTGNRQLNAALHRIALTQAHWHEPAKQMMERRKAGGDSGLEVLRVLTRRSLTSSTRPYEPTSLRSSKLLPLGRGA